MVFLFKQKTAYEMRISDWSSDVCSSDLRSLRARELIAAIRPANARFNDLYQVPTFDEIVALLRAKEAETGRRVGIYPELKHPKIGRAACRERVCEYV